MWYNNHRFTLKGEHQMSEQLVRDQIPAQNCRRGFIQSIRVAAGDEEFLQHLCSQLQGKMFEHAREPYLYMLVDLYESLRTIASLSGMTEEQLVSTALEKCADAGIAPHDELYEKLEDNVYTYMRDRTLEGIINIFVSLCGVCALYGVAITELLTSAQKCRKSFGGYDRRLLRIIEP